MLKFTASGNGWTGRWLTGAQMTRPRFFTPAEVAAHNAPDDLWVSFLGKVFDLTSLAKKHAGWRCANPQNIFCSNYDRRSLAEADHGVGGHGHLELVRPEDTGRV